METIKEFLKRDLIFKNGYGNGYGYGYGNGYGDEYGNGYGDEYGNGNGYGDGNGYGYGDGNGNGNGNGYGNGNGNGYGNGMKSFNNQTVYLIDNIKTIITSVKNNTAKGFILNNNLSLTPCYIVKSDNLFSHGSSLKEAFLSLEAKLLQNLPVSELISKFKNVFKNQNIKYPALDYFTWHYNLTKSCLMGRNSFVENNNIDLKKDSFTIQEFIDLTKNSYGSAVILELEKSYK